MIACSMEAALSSLEVPAGNQSEDGCYSVCCTLLPTVSWTKGFLSREKNGKDILLLFGHVRNLQMPPKYSTYPCHNIARQGQSAKGEPLSSS